MLISLMLGIVISGHLDQGVPDFIWDYQREVCLMKIRQRAFNRG